MSENWHALVTGWCSAVTGSWVTIRGMAARRRERLRWIGDQPLCAICAGSGSGECAEHHLTHGVSVWLCETHRSDAFLRRRGGRDFVESLAGLWIAAGGASTRQRSALATHLARLEEASTRSPLPGSYSWPRLRAEAEQRFAAGEHPRLVISELRTRHSADDATAPSVRTMRRWFTEARWLAAAPPDPADSGGSRTTPRRSGPSRTASRRTTINGSPWWYGWPVEWLPRGYP